MESQARRVALVTGVGRRAGIGAAIVERLAADGLDVGFTYWSPYDARMPWGTDDRTTEELLAALDEAGARGAAVEADLERVESAAAVFDRVEAEVGPVCVLVASHCEGVATGILDTTVESFDRHFAVNARATWLLIREFGLRYRPAPAGGRIITLTSDHTVGHVPYGSSKGAADRITLAAAHELGPRGVTANAINPGGVDTGWMSEDVKAQVIAGTPLGRLGETSDVANLVSFLCSPEGGWISGQLLYSNGGAAP